MKTINRLLGVALIASSLSAFAGEGAVGGNGGGGICQQDGKCITLAEAGFRIPLTENQTEPGYELPGDLLAELDKINSMFPESLQYYRAASVIGERGTIVMLEVADRKKMKRFLKQYQNLLKSKGSHLANDVEILAFTLGKKTFLIREKFESLSVRSKALLLIHEANLRSRNFSLEQVLQIDGVVLDYINAVESGRRPSPANLLKVYDSVGFMNELFAKSYLLNEALLVTGPVSLKSNQYDSVGPSDYGDNLLSFSYDNLLRLQNSKQELRSVLKEKQAYGLSNLLRRDDFLKRIFNVVGEMVVANNGKMIVTEELLKSVKAKLGEAYESEMDLCTGAQDSSIILSATKVRSELEGTPRGATVIECNDPYGSPSLMRPMYACNVGQEKVYNFYKFPIEAIDGTSILKPMTCSLKSSEKINCDVYYNVRQVYNIDCI